ncbi:MAG: integrase arm-type DNA-binding domain-containing protein, partial [Hyphomicrobiaceae bacterium]
MKFTKSRITTRAVEALVPGETIADTLLPGFFVRRQQGARIYFVRKHAHGRRHFIAIGEHGREGWTEAKARAAALDIIVAIRHGRDPAAERTKLKTMPLLADFAADVVAQRAAVLKPSSITNYRITLDKHIAPRDARGILRRGCLGAMRMDSVTRQHVTVLHRAMRATPRAANYVLDLLNVVYR